MLGTHDRQGSVIRHECPGNIIGHDAERRLYRSAILRRDNDRQKTKDDHKQLATRPLGPGSKTMVPGAIQCHQPPSFKAGDTRTPTLSTMRGHGQASVTIPGSPLGSCSPQRLYRVAIHHAHSVTRESRGKLDPLGSFVARDTTADVFTHCSRREVLGGGYLYHSLNGLSPLRIWHAEHADTS